MANYKIKVKQTDGTFKELPIKVNGESAEIPEDLTKIGTIPYNSTSIFSSLKKAYSEGKTFISYTFRLADIDFGELPTELISIMSSSDEETINVTAFFNSKGLTGALYDVTLTYSRADVDGEGNGYVYPIRWNTSYVIDEEWYNYVWEKIYPCEDTFTKAKFYNSLLDSLSKAFEENKKFLSYTFHTSDVSDFPSFINLSEDENSLVNVTAVLNGLPVTGQFYEVTLTQWSNNPDSVAGEDSEGIYFIPNKWINIYNPNNGFINQEWIRINTDYATTEDVNTAIENAIGSAINEDY